MWDIISICGCYQQVVNWNDWRDICNHAGYSSNCCYLQDELTIKGSPMERLAGKITRLSWMGFNNLSWSS